MESLPRLYADDHGVWCEKIPGHPYGIAWDEIAFVSGYKLDGITEVYTVVVLDFANGEYIELLADWPGFDQAVQAIGAELPGISPDWLSKIERLKPRQDAIAVWKKYE